ncbi:hypothetical protein AgCh_025539 [Apium graveolens]
MSRFLGPLKRCVPLTYVLWEHVPTTLKKTLWDYAKETLEKKLNSSEGLDGVDELISGGKKSHAPGWLIGRHDTKTVKKATSAASSDQYLQKLTNKIKENCVEEMEVKIENINQKKQENLALVLKRLANTNPS